MKWVVYSHTDYLDVLKIQTDYNSKIPNKVLLINKSDEDIRDITSKYDAIVYYDDKLPYASRLLELDTLFDPYIILLHDIDIPVHVDLKFIQECLTCTENNGWGRLDLKHHMPGEAPVRITNIYQYPYNVNPGIWRLDSLLHIMNKYPDATYRTIEDLEVQKWVGANLESYRLCSDNPVSCGYYTCVPQFQYLHLTHGGKFMPQNNDYMHPSISRVYNDICEKYLKDTKREFRESMWSH